MTEPQTEPNVVTAAFERRRATSEAPCSPATLNGNSVYAGDGFDVAGAGSTQRTPFATAGRASSHRVAAGYERRR
jgi:hypothetical protein